MNEEYKKTSHLVRKFTRIGGVKNWKIKKKYLIRRISA